MSVVPLEIDLQSNPGRYGHDGGGRLINAYPEEAGAKAKGQYPIYAIEGLTSFATLSGGLRVRGAISLGDYGYVVAGTLVFKVAADGTATSLGTFPGSSPVFMARNRKATPQIMLVSSGLRYIIEDDVVSSIATTNLPSVNSVAFLGGYFVATHEDGRFFISDEDEGQTWVALDFATTESKADDLYVAYARGREVVFFGSESIEFWPLTGAAAFPFEANTSAFINNLGCMCRHSVKDLADVVFFVASDGTVRRLNGYVPERISTHAVERDIDGVEAKDDITATTYSLRGHQFYVLSSPSWTWVYDGLTNLWHERVSYGEDRWRGEVFVDIAGHRCIGDFASGLLYEIDPDAQDEAGQHLIWRIRTPPMHAYPHQAVVDVLFLDLIPGTGLNSTNEHVADPKVMLRYSDNGGKSFSNERTKSLGRIGEFKRKVKFTRLGQTGEDGRIWEIAVSAAVIRGLTGSSVDVTMVQA